MSFYYFSIDGWCRPLNGIVSCIDNDTEIPLKAII